MFGFQFVNDAQTIQREMDQLFRHFGFNEAVAKAAPRIAFKVTDQGEAFQVEAVAPGIDAEKLSIDVIGRKIKIAGEFKAEEHKEDVRWYRNERRKGSFEKIFALPADIDIEKVEAEYKLGILKINLPKAQSALPKKIAVNAA